MQGSLKIARVMGIQIAVHFSWFAIFALVTWTLSAVYFPTRYPAWSPQTAWYAGVLTSVLFFASVLAHELAHSVVARRLGLEVESITLFVFGGMASIVREAERPRHEFAIAFVGPLSSLGLGLGFALAGLIAERAAAMEVAGAVAWWLATINVMLALFNLVPGFPMDGGRVLRSLLWGATRNFWLATRIAATAGLVVAYLLMLGGLFLAVTGAFFNAAWVILVGWFLSNSAHASYRQAKVRESLRGVTVGQAMTRDCQTVSPHLSLGEAFENYFRPQRLAAIPVVADDSRILGLLTHDNLKRVPMEYWDVTPVTEVMTGLADTQTVTPQDEVNEVLSALGGKDFEETPVVEGGHFVGLLTRRDVLDLLRGRGQRGRRGAET